MDALSINASKGGEPPPDSASRHSGSGSRPRDFATPAAPLFSYTTLLNNVTNVKAANKALDAQQYLRDIVSKQFPGDIEMLDFRTPEGCMTENAPGRAQEATSHRWTVRLHGIEPPDEHDWFSLDRMGKILPMSEAHELFSILKESKSAAKVKQLLINARRSEYWACPKEQMPTFSDTLLQMKNLTKIVLRGMADDYMMQLIGKTATGLKYIDVSCSKFVTDKGVLHLFFENVVENSAQYLIASWIQKNLDNMWPLVHTLEYLDFSWTNVTSLSRKMVNLLPGSYMFKRHFAVTENEAFGHHIFIRKMSDYTTTIRAHDKDKNHKFQAELHSFAGRKGVSSFMKFLEGHAWKRSHFTTFVYRPHQVPVMGTLLKADELDDAVSVCIITPTLDDKRIHGLVTFWQGNLIELYSIYPINLNQLGSACPKLRILNATITDVWRHTGSLLPTLAEADLFGEPDSVMSLLNCCPNLKKVRVRIIKKVLTDEALIQALSLSMSNRYLEELWIAPGSYKNSGNFASEDSEIADVDAEDDESKVTLLSSSLLIPAGESSGTRLFHGDAEDEESMNDSRIEDLVHLSAHCLRRLFECCKKLNRVGNLASWNISNLELQSLRDYLAETNSGAKLVWDNVIISVGSKTA